MALPDKWVARAITGPSSATQMTPAPASAIAPDTEWMAQGAPLIARGPAARAHGDGRPRPTGRRPPLPLGQVPSSLFTRAGGCPGSQRRSA